MGGNLPAAVLALAGVGAHARDVDGLRFLGLFRRGLLLLNLDERGEEPEVLVRHPLAAAAVERVHPHAKFPFRERELRGDLLRVRLGGVALPLGRVKPPLGRVKLGLHRVAFAFKSVALLERHVALGLHRVSLGLHRISCDLHRVALGDQRGADAAESVPVLGKLMNASGHRVCAYVTRSRYFVQENLACCLRFFFSSPLRIIASSRDETSTRALSAALFTALLASLTPPEIDGKWKTPFSSRL